MKKSILHLTTCFLFISLCMATMAQTTPTASPKNAIEEKRNREIKKVALMIQNITAAVKITDEQKTRLETSLQVCFKKFDDAREGIHGDDSKLEQLKSELQEDLIASIKTVLTPAQFSTAMEQSNSK